MNKHQLKLLLPIASLAASGAATPEFDRWADRLAADWARSDPQFATRAQYFSREEQDALDRRLTLRGAWGNAFGRSEALARAEAARRGLDELRRFPLAGLAPTQRASAAHYSPPAPDGSKPGTFWLPLPGPTFGLLGIRSLAYHEAVPGHHFQIALQQTNAPS